MSADPSPAGRFIVLEGGDGCGKTTQVRLLVERLRAAGYDVVATKEPGGTAAGAAIRALVLGDEPLDARTEALLVAADRAEHVARVVRPALRRGAVVVSDRYVPSSLAYQGVGRDLGVEAVAQLSAWATGGLEPDAVVVLDAAPDVTAARRPGPLDRLEREPAGFHAEVGRAYRELADRHGWVVLDGSGPVEEVAEAVWNALRPLLGAPTP